MPKIIIPQKNKILTVLAGSNLMKVLQLQNIPVASSCLGDGICGKCRMKIQGQVADATELEMQTKERNKIPLTERLACQISMESDLTVTTDYW